MHRIYFHMSFSHIIKPLIICTLCLHTSFAHTVGTSNSTFSVKYVSTSCLRILFEHLIEVIFVCIPLYIVFAHLGYVHEAHKRSVQTQPTKNRGSIVCSHSMSKQNLYKKSAITFVTVMLKRTVQTKCANKNQFNINVQTTFLAWCTNIVYATGAVRCATNMCKRSVQTQCANKYKFD